jgi:hypothetical protein
MATTATLLSLGSKPKLSISDQQFLAFTWILSSLKGIPQRMKLDRDLSSNIRADETDIYYMWAGDRLKQSVPIKIHLVCATLTRS